MKLHKRLIIWSKLMVLIKDIYSVSDKFPKEELFGITSQMKRAAVSVASNIAEGCARGGVRKKSNSLPYQEGL